LFNLVVGDVVSGPGAPGILATRANIDHGGGQGIIKAAADPGGSGAFVIGLAGVPRTDVKRVRTGSGKAHMIDGDGFLQLRICDLLVRIIGSTKRAAPQGGRVLDARPDYRLRPCGTRGSVSLNIIGYVRVDDLGRSRCRNQDHTVVVGLVHSRSSRGRTCKDNKGKQYHELHRGSLLSSNWRR